MPTVVLDNLSEHIKLPYVATKSATVEDVESHRFVVSGPGSEIILAGWIQDEDGFLIPDDHSLVVVTSTRTFRRKRGAIECDNFVSLHSELGLRDLTDYEYTGVVDLKTEAEQAVHGNTH
jgi:hypothetical protein